MTTSSTAARIAAGAIWETVIGPGDKATEVKFERCPAGWQATFELNEPTVTDLAVVHRLVADTLKEARQAVPHAIAFLLGEPL